jgi:hypothetical protein
MPTANVRYEGRLSMRLHTEEAQRLSEAAAADDRPPSTFARRLILEGLDQLDHDHRVTGSHRPTGAA